MNFQECLDIVKRINKDLDNAGEGMIPILNLITNGEDMSFDFMGDILWESRDDLREQDPVTGQLEPLEKYLRTLIKESLEDISSINENFKIE